MSALASNKCILADPSAPCGLLISQTKDESSMEESYPVEFFPCKIESDLNIFTVHMQNGTKKSFQKRIAREGYWYGEDERDGSSLNFLFDDGNDGTFVTGSLIDLPTGDVIQFRSYEEQTFAFVKNSSEFYQD